MPRSWDHPDVWGDREAALVASQQTFIELCESEALLERAGRIEGVGTISGASLTLPEGMGGDFFTDLGRLNFESRYGGSPSATLIQAWCIVAPPNIEISIWDSVAKRSLFTVSSAINVFSWRTGFKFGDNRFRVRCVEANCGREEASDQTASKVVKSDDEKPEKQYLYIYYLSANSTQESDMKEYWIAGQEAKITKNEKALRKIRVNWLDWMDRVDLGHPVFQIETDDLSRQCERAEILTAELDALEAVEYREWFDVCER